MSILVDTSVWVSYFRSGENYKKLDFLIDENLIAINDLIVAELVPFLKVRNQRKIIKLLLNIKKLDLSINWSEIIDYQFKCLKNGLNGIGIPDLIIAQNAKQNNCAIYSLDNHYWLIKESLNLQIFK
ncbi:MAG: PIN domain-containing protein [Deltaproteobacteria bacterium]|nr:PIN domain-containing protein [Deltaproteobacteria bacterium]